MQSLLSPDTQNIRPHSKGGKSMGSEARAEILALIK